MKKAWEWFKKNWKWFIAPLWILSMVLVWLFTGTRQPLFPPSGTTDEMADELAAEKTKPGCTITNNKFLGDRTDSNQQGRAIVVNDITRGAKGTVIKNNTFKDIIGRPSSGTEYRVIWIEGDDTGFAAGSQVCDNTFIECGCDDTTASISSRIIDVEGDGYTIERNVFLDSYGPQVTSGSQYLIYSTGAVFDHAVINDNIIIEDALTSAGRITLGDWAGIKVTSVSATACRNEFHTTSYDTSITANGVTEYFIDMPGGNICHNVMGLRVRNTVTTKKFINGSTGTGQFIGNRCSAAAHTMDFGSGDKAVVIGNVMPNSLGGTIQQTGEELIAIGNAAYTALTFSGGASTPGLVMGNIVYGGGTTNAGSHNTTGNL